MARRGKQTRRKRARQGRPLTVVFICTGNCCRSQMAEALLRQMGGKRFIARSAGSNPAGYIHPLAIETMGRLNVPMNGQSSKSWDTLAGDRHDIILTLCDHAAMQPCPAWPGHPATAHWSLPDPSFMPATQEQRLEAAGTVAATLQRWIGQLIKLKIHQLPREQLQAELQRIAET